jgi:Cu2+-exporting ATPase
MQVMQLIERAQARKPVLTELTQRISGWFIGLVIVLAAITALYYLRHDPALWLPATIAVLVVSCPCALAIATPTALTAASSSLMRQGVALIHPNALEALATADEFVFDKTGTLTTGRLALSAVATLGGRERDAVLRIAAALEAHSEHPVARAILAAAAPVPAGEVRNFPGEGLAGAVEGTEYLLGSAGFIRTRHPATAPELERLGGATDEKTAFLATADGVLCAAFEFSDQLRPGAIETIAHLRAAGRGITILSGDHARAVASVAAQLGLDAAHGGLTPPEKLAAVTALQAAGRRVVAVGDGVNDAPILAQADVSFALNEAADHAKLNADIVILREGLDAVRHAHRIALLTRAVVRQNIAWSIAYNVLALPLALAGYITPWIGALGMSLSSLLVIANAARIYRAR